MNDIILASASPRRKEILSRITNNFSIMPVDADESSTYIAPHLKVMDIARKKALAARELAPNKHIISADTLVFLKNAPLSKPKDKNDAKQMLLSLSSKHHRVLTGVCIIRKDGKMLSFYDSTKVFVSHLSNEEINAYLDSGEYADKAGSYAIQGLFSKHIKKIEGNYDNVVGLPLEALYQNLKNLNIL